MRQKIGGIVAEYIDQNWVAFVNLAKEGVEREGRGAIFLEYQTVSNTVEPGRNKPRYISPSEIITLLGVSNVLNEDR